MGAPGSGMKAAEQPTAEALLTAFKTIPAAERRKHASVLNYWLSIRGDKEFPPLHDLDPLELSDAGPNSALLELISGGHDAEIRHLGEALRGDDWPEQIMDAPDPSILSCIAKKLPIVAISRDFLAFEDEFATAEGKTRCWVTLLPLSAGGAWVDYVYALVSLDSPAAKAEKPAKAPKKVEQPEAAIDEVDEPVEAIEEELVEDPAEAIEEEFADVPEIPAEPDPVQILAVDADDCVDAVEDDEQPPSEGVAAAVAKAAPGFSKLFDSLAGLTGFYSQPVKVDPVIDFEVEEPVDEAPADEPVDEAPAAPVDEALVDEPVREEPVVEEPIDELPRQNDKQPRASEGPLQTKLTEVRAKADEARMARLRATAALCDGLSAAYDFALDAEEAPEEYLRLVEAQGLKIQLRSPMKPVVKLAFDGLCDEATIAQLEAVLSWALKQDLPRGGLADRIEQTGGLGNVLEAKAA
jgi:hypothetical protein